MVMEIVRYSKEADALWHKIIDSKYGSHTNGWDTNLNPKCTLQAPWKSIIKEWSSFINYTKIQVGRGDKTEFWNDVWIGDKPLKEIFPRLFSISKGKKLSVAEMINGQSTSSYTWDI